MKKIQKLQLRSESIRHLSSATLTGVVGGISGNHCSIGLTGCGGCPAPRPSLAFSNCVACATDVCSFDACNGTVVVIHI